jgi:N-methylhydantoinase A/oxoprolinase/acetone carboxylase beta subunit
MSIALGIDTRGTYTDAILVNYDNSESLAGAKALTTPHDFSIGIREAVVKVLSQNTHTVSPDVIELVGLSTTLATNAIVEGHGSPVCLRFVFTCLMKTMTLRS